MGAVHGAETEFWLENIQQLSVFINGLILSSSSFLFSLLCILAFRVYEVFQVSEV